MKPFYFPDLNPVAIRLGPFAIRWYALAYIAALLIAWWLLRRLVQERPQVASPVHVDDFLSWATLGVVIGGRLGYVLFYQPGYYFTHPRMIYAVWDGGMSFHGGLLGVAVAILWFCHKNKLNPLDFADRVAIAAPIGLGLGRIANFVNGELFGRVAPSWWPFTVIYPKAAIMFPKEGLAPRFPSELYEAILEGLILFIVMYRLSRGERRRTREGFLTGSFLLGYALARIVGELFREPDPFLGFLWFGATMGQLLSIPLLAIGVWLILRSRRHVVQPLSVEGRT